MDGSHDAEEADMSIAIEWADGTIDRGPTPASVLAVVAETQWHPTTPEEMLEKLSDRAWVLGHHAIDPQLPLEEFFAKLAEAGIITILDWTPEEVPGGGIGEATSLRLTMRQRRAREEAEWAAGQ